MKKKSKETITIRRKMIAGIMSAVPLTAILISRRDVGALVLFLVGIGIGIFIGRNSVN